MWLTSYNGGTISRIDPATNTVVFQAYLNGAINGITEGLGGIWVADTSNGRLYLIDPSATGVNAYLDEPYPQVAEAPPVVAGSSFSLTSLFK